MFVPENSRNGLFVSIGSCQSAWDFISWLEVSEFTSAPPYFPINKQQTELEFIWRQLEVFTKSFYGKKY